MRHSWTIAVHVASVAAQFNYNHTQYGTSPAVYPSPKTAGAGGWGEALGRARAFLAELTLEEKTQIVTGKSTDLPSLVPSILTDKGTAGPCVGNIGPIERLNFSGLCLHDGPLAVRQAVYVSVFPAGVSAAASWDRALVRQRGAYMGAEFRKKGAHVALGPSIGPLGRSPYGGRNWEGFGSDPYLSGVLVEETIHGIQSAGVQACTKHYIGQCEFCEYCKHISDRCSQRTGDPEKPFDRRRCHYRSHQL